MELIYSHCLIRLNISRENKHVGFNRLKLSNNFTNFCYIRAAFSQQSHGVQENSDHRGGRSTIASISAAMHWNRRWTLWDLIDRRPMVRTLSMLKTNAMARRGNVILKEQSWIAVWSP